MTSSKLALADLVEHQQAGVALDSLSLKSVLAGLRAFMENYDELANAAMKSDLSEFSRDRFLEAYERVYRSALKKA